jgi:hypothetical protein
MKNFNIHTSHKVLLGNEIKEGEMNGARCTHVKREKGIQHFGRKT